jgi:hypothetical protein
MAQVTTRILSWQEMVQRTWGADYTAPEVAYEFTRKKFNDQPMNLDGVSLNPSESLYADDYATDYA